MNKLSPDPRLPIPPSDTYQRNLNVRLYEVIRDLTSQVTALIDGHTRVVTTTEKNALTAFDGMVVFDTTLNKLCVYTGSSWETITSA